MTRNSPNETVIRNIELVEYKITSGRPGSNDEYSVLTIEFFDSDGIRQHTIKAFTTIGKRGLVLIPKP